MFPSSNQPQLAALFCTALLVRCVKRLFEFKENFYPDRRMQPYLKKNNSLLWVSIAQTRISNFLYSINMGCSRYFWIMKLPFSFLSSYCFNSSPSSSTVSKSLIPRPLFRSLGFKSHKEPSKASSGQGLTKGLSLFGVLMS